VEREKVGGEAVVCATEGEKCVIDRERGGESVVCATEGEKWGYLI